MKQIEILVLFEHMSQKVGSNVVMINDVRKYSFYVYEGVGLESGV